MKSEIAPIGDRLNPVTRQWTQLLHENTTVDFLKLTTAFIVVRLGKGVVMSLVLLTFTLQFNHLEPTFTYIIITALYFLLTQFKGEAGEETAMVEATRKLGLHILEGMEEYWLPLIISAAAVVMSTVVLCMALLELNVLLLCLLLGYANVYVAGLQMMENCWKPLSVQNAVVAVFPLASPKKLEQRGDTLCPVCLDDMRILTARVTPCNHIFHTSCLRKCVLLFGHCPLCKQPL
uniref:RING-type domain-containing protein n=1 Tax=Timema douglasi TaxID=61478 RepID=A0A7R8VAM6_TIMDO|nr:unnamed protein product [Timema douglasi]